MFAVCSSWFEIDERKWTYYHHGSHNDWELGAKTTAVPASKVLDSEWHCFAICKTPQWQFWFILRSAHHITSVFFLVSFLFFVYLGNHTSPVLPGMLRCSSHGFAEHLPLNTKCVISLKFSCRVVDWCVLGGLQYGCKFLLAFHVFTNSESITTEL